MRNVRLILALVMCAATLGAQPVPLFHGTWTATLGPKQVLHGTWRGRALPGRPNVGEGTWMLIRAGNVVMGGTWRAEKAPRRWQGTWSGRTMDGRRLRGTWGAYLQEWSGKTFQEMLERTMQHEVAGWWESGRAQGHWWLRGAPSSEIAPQKDSKKH